MILTDYQMLLDVHEGSSQISLSFKQNDSGRVLHITLTEEGDIFDIPQGSVAVFTARKPDGHIIFNDCEIDGNEISYRTTDQTTAVTGKVDCEIQLYGAGNSLLTSPHFTIFVHPAVVADLIESADEVNTLTNLIYEASSKLENGDFVPKLSVGTVNTLPAGEYATVELTGTADEPVLNFGIPQGEQGQAETLLPDVEFSETSTKPVQNRIITIALNGLSGAITAHVNDKENPHMVSAEQVGLGNVDNTSDNDKPVSTAQQEALDAKVDKETGKGLSTNDFTDALKAKLDGIEEKANNFTIGAGEVTDEMLAAGAVTADKVATEARTQYYSVYILNEWEGDAAPYTHTATVTGLLSTDKPKVFFTPPESFDALENAQAAYGLLYDVESADGAATFYAKEKPEAEFSVTLEVSRI